MEGPAAPGFDESAVDVEASAGENDIAAALDAFSVSDDVDHGESETANSGDDVDVGVLGMAVASGELVAPAVGGEDFFEIVGSKAVVGVEDEVGIVDGAFGVVDCGAAGYGFGTVTIGGFGEDLLDSFVKSITLTLFLGVWADDDGSAVLTTDFDSGVAVGFDDNIDVAHGVGGAMSGGAGRVGGVAGEFGVGELRGLEDGLLSEGFQKTFDDGAFVASGDKDGDFMRVVAMGEVEFFAAEDGARGEKPSGAEENEDESDENCHV